MKTKQIPLTLVSLKLKAYGADSPLTHCYPGELLFDERSDFAIDFSQSALAVLLTFSNERALKYDHAPGIRRPVSVSLIDVTDSCVLSTTLVKVNIPHGQVMEIFRVDFPLVYANIDRLHSCKVSVRDDNSGHLLGERCFNLFDGHFSGKHLAECFTPSMGGLVKLGTGEIYKSLHAECPGYCAAHFRLRCSFAERPWVMPEMEIRMHYPNSSVDCQYGKLECEEYDQGEYSIEIPFFMQHSKLGIGYAELLCMDCPIGGFVFCTNDDEVAGAWEGSELDCMEHHSLEAFASRYRYLMPTHGGAPVLTNEDVQRALQAFIDSQMVDEWENGPADDDDDDADADDDEEAYDSDDGEADGDLPQSDTQPEEAEEAEEAGKADEASTGAEAPSIMAALNRLTGLASVKEKLATYEKVVKFNKMRRDNNLPTNPLPLHAVFLGSPGTGKTTVAKRMGIMLRRAGVLSRGHLVIKERSTLLGPNYSNEESNTLQAIEEAQGGILFIDEAYQLYQPNDPRDPGKLVIEALMTALADETKRDWMLILAGYPEEMKRMFEINTGFKSRIPESNIYIFDDFTEEELMEIAERYLDSTGYTLTPEAREALKRRLAGDFAARDKNFGNARHVINMIQTEILPAMAARVVSDQSQQAVDTETLSVIQPSDIPLRSNRIQTRRPRIGYRP